MGILEGIIGRKFSKWVRIVVGVLLLSALVLVVDINVIARALSGVSLKWLVVSAALIAASTLLGACNLYLLLDKRTEVRFPTFLSIYWTGWALNLVVPGQVGDMAGISVLLRRYEIPLHVSISRSLVDKALSVVAIASMGLLGVWLYLRASALEIITADLGLAITLAAVIGVAVALFLLTIVSRHSERITAFGRHMVRDIWLVATLQPRRIVTNLIGSVTKMALTGLAYWCAFSALGYQDTDPVAVMLLAAASSLVAYIPISFNGVGTVELAGVVLFGSLEIPAHVVVSAYLLLRAIVLVLACTPLALRLAVSPTKSA